MCLGYMRILGHFMYETGAPSDFGTNSQRIVRDDCPGRRRKSWGQQLSSVHLRQHPRPALWEVPALWEGFNAFSVANEPVSGGKLSEDVSSGPCTGFTGPTERRKEVTRLKRTHRKGPGTQISCTAVLDMCVSDGS